MTYDYTPDELPPGPEELPGLPGDAPKKPPEEFEGDLLCIECGYNLRGLTRRHRCPECGTPASFSTSGNRLALASSPWLKKVSYGLLLIMGSVCLYVIALLNSFVSATGFFVDLCSAVMAAAAAFYLTAVEPRGAQDPREQLRIGLRVIALARLGCALTVWLAPWGTLQQIAFCASQLTALGVAIVVAVYLRTFAQRLDDYELERATWQVAWVLSLCVTIFFAVSLLAIPLTGSGTMAPYCVMLLTATLAFAAVIWFLVLLLKYYNAVSWAAFQSARKGEPPPAARLDLLEEESSQG